MTWQAETVSADRHAGLQKTTNTVVEQRLLAYRWLSRLLFPRNFTVKVLLLAFVVTHVPLLGIVGYMLFITELNAADVRRVLLVSGAATLTGTLLALTGLWVMLTPVISASRSLTAYRRDGTRPTLPTDIEDEGGRLLADVQHTLVELDEALLRATKIASHDGLTGVFTRREGERRLQHDLVSARASGRSLVVLVLDTDGLKGVNDRWGHAAGDAYLRHLTSVITREVGDDGWVARWGGDEFVVRWTGEVTTAETLLDRINAGLAAIPVRVASGASTTITVSAGIASSSSTDTPMDVVERADAALYDRKRTRGAKGT